jgi:hypothetical protein
VTLHVRALRDRILPGGGGVTRRRNWLILVDTCVTALTGLALLIGAARALTPAALSSFALAQLIVVTSVGILRPAFYSAAMAAQRTTGPASVPLRWTVTIAQPAALVVTVIIILLVRSPDWPQWSLSVALAVGIYLAQDAVRNVLVSRSQPAVILLADLSTCVLVLGFLALHRGLSSPSALMLFWGAAGIPGLVFAVVRARRGTAARGREQSLAETWRLGRWGAADAALAAVAALVPMVVSTALISPTASGTYRVLQSALGPLNILFTTVLTVLTLDSWHTASRAGLHSLQRKVVFILFVMLGGALLYLPLALPALAWVSGLQGPDVTRAAVVVGVVGLLTAASTPFVGAALALGRQHWGVGIRLVTVGIAIAVCVNSSLWVPWQDPIGVSMLGAAVVALVGWVVAYWVANRRESLSMGEQPPAQEVTSHRA